MELDSSQGIRASVRPSLDSIQDLVACFVRYLELRLQLLGLESRETGFHLLILALLFVSVLVCLGGFVVMSVVFLLYLMMLILHWEWGWSAPGTCSGAPAYQYWVGGNLQIQDRQAIFPSDLGRVSKGS
jgi:uncharacterized membrane protein YqjE